MKSLINQLVALACCITFVASVQAQAVVPLPLSVAQLLQRANLPSEAIGIYVLPVGNRDGAALLSLNSTKSMQPASTIKVLTSAIALDTLGPAARSEVQLLTTVRPTPKTTVLDSPLVLRASGSPDLTLIEFKALLKQLRSDGLQTIRGDLVIDRSWLRPSRPDLGAAPFDEAPEFRYNFIPDALSLDMNLSTLVIGSDANLISGQTIPIFENIRVANTMTLNNLPCNLWENKWLTPLVSLNADGQTQITLRGEFPKDCKVETRLNLLDRTVYADALFKSIWQELGGRYLGTTRELSVDDPALLAKIPIATHQSRPLSETIRDINKRSDNPTTRLLYLSLGAVGQNQASFAQSEIVARNWFRLKGIDDTGLVLDNGSGLSRSERITPMQLAAVLMNAYEGQWAPEFLASLPIIGLDGSMRNRLKTSSAAQRGRIKTGGLKDVASIAGYVTDLNNKTFVVVAFINHPTAQSGASRALLDGIIEWVANGER